MTDSGRADKRNECAHCGSHDYTTMLSTLRYGAAEICEMCRLNNRVLYRRIRSDDADLDALRAAVEALGPVVK